jgi:hypothetical protein
LATACPLKRVGHVSKTARCLTVPDRGRLTPDPPLQYE